jgi:hypothetical protein
LITGGAVVIVLIASLVYADVEGRPMWPVVVAAVAFFYLWWLAILLFDLVFVWHRYVRHSMALVDLHRLTSTPAGPPTGSRPA